MIINLLPKRNYQIDRRKSKISANSEKINFQPSDLEKFEKIYGNHSFLGDLIANGKNSIFSKKEITEKRELKTDLQTIRKFYHFQKIEN